MPKSDLKIVEQKEPHYCSFCGKSEAEVQKLITGPIAKICDECIYLSLDVLNNLGVKRIK